MILVCDVHYFERGGARAAGIVLADWPSCVPEGEFTARIAEVAPYVSGAFYRRELPCILALLRTVVTPITQLVVDANVWLGEQAGLGAHVHHATGLPVLGIAKRPHAAGGGRPVVRGGSTVPLLVSAVGLPLELACQHVQHMCGAHRIPTMVKRADRLARDGPA